MGKKPKTRAADRKNVQRATKKKKKKESSKEVGRKLVQQKKQKKKAIWGERCPREVERIVGKKNKGPSGGPQRK